VTKVQGGRHRSGRVVWSTPAGNARPARQVREQYCENGLTLTYNGEDKILGGVTYGGYSTAIVVDEKYVLKRA